MRILAIAISLSFFLVGCTDKTTINLNPQNLLSYGVPLTIMAPDSAEIKKEDWGSMQIVTVKKGKDYDLQIQSSEATSTDIATVKAQKIIDVKNERYFSKIIKEDPNGFVFETQPDSTTNYYGFRYITIQGDKEYVIQTGLAGNYTLEQAENMYEAVKPKKKK
jgi:hypothetical protein